MKEISINQLTNEEQFFKLKEDFLLRDEQFLFYLKHMDEGDAAPEVNYEINDISFMRECFTDLSDEFGVTYYESTGYFDDVKENFYDDYLHPIIKNMLYYYIRQLDIKFIEKDILDPSDVKHFGNKMIDVLNTKLKAIESSSHLNESTRDLIKSVFDDIINNIYDKHVKDLEAEKIHFNLNKNQVVILFNLLHDNKVISATPIIDFNVKIQKFFRFKCGTEFKEIDGAYKVYDELLGEKSTKSPLPTLKKLKKIFEQPAFFDPIVK